MTFVCNCVIEFIYKGEKIGIILKIVLLNLEKKAITGLALSTIILFSGSSCESDSNNNSEVNPDEDEKTYAIIVDNNDNNKITVIPCDFAYKDVKKHTYCNPTYCIVFDNMSSIEVPIANTYIFECARSQEDVEDFIYTVISEDANITYYNYNEKQDVKSKTKTKTR